MVRTVKKTGVQFILRGSSLTKKLYADLEMYLTVQHVYCMSGKQTSVSLVLKLLDSCQICDRFASSMPVLQPLPNYLSELISLDKSVLDTVKNQLENPQNSSFHNQELHKRPVPKLCFELLKN